MFNIFIFIILYKFRVDVRCYSRYEAGVAQWLERRVCKRERCGFESRRRAKLIKNVLFGCFLAWYQEMADSMCLSLDGLLMWGET